MRKLVLLVAMLGLGNLYAQEAPSEIRSYNSWLKLGVNAGVPVGDSGDISSALLGVDFRGQHLITENWGIGIASGYNHYFGKDGVEDFGTIPLAGFVRYYFTPSGVFFGSDFGYNFLTNVENNSGGMYVNPQLGYHNEDWNIYGFFQNTFLENDAELQTVGLGVTYNIRWNKKK